jgi:hypothetical protein
MFEIGQQVVCLSGDWVFELSNEPPENAPVPGQAYTIRGFHREPDGWLGLRLEEIYIPRPNGPEPAFNVAGFRPVRKTSIEDFNKLLVTPPKVLEPA